MQYIGTAREEIHVPIYEWLLTNRGIAKEDIFNYLNTTDEHDIVDYKLLGEQQLRAAAGAILKAIYDGEKALLVVDCDCDGYTSAAILYNYLYTQYPDWTYTNLDFYIHEGKEHGLHDCIDKAENYKLVLCPDSASNDYNEHKRIVNNGGTVIVLDHHLADKISPDAIIINNQLSNYTNKEGSGATVTWQFCRYLDENLFHSNTVDDFLDLVALGSDADMMDLRSFETKHLMNKGFGHIKNPFIFGMAKKNAFSLGPKVTPIGAAFYIAPMINAITRSGTLDEKTLVFKSMLIPFANQLILSNKRGHKLGEEEKLIDQALRCATNVKNRQTKAQDAGMEYLESMIEKNNMLEHKALIFLLEHDEVSPSIRGLIANKFMAKYQRPCAILTKHIEDDGTLSYAGSARGYTKTGIKDFRLICKGFKDCIYAEGHENALGLSIVQDAATAFIDYLDDALADAASEPIYYCDIVYYNKDINEQDIYDIADLEDLWGQEMPEPLVAINKLIIEDSMITFYEKKGITIKITLPNGITLMKFRATEEEKEIFSFTGSKTMNIVGKCNKNEYMGRITPQIFIEDYDILQSQKFVF